MDERIFDVSKPHKVDPGATSKPVIVGHHPEIPDPMIRENAPDKPQIPEQPEFGPPSEGNPLGLPEVPSPLPGAGETALPTEPPNPENEPQLPTLLEPEESPASSTADAAEISTDIPAPEGIVEPKLEKPEHKSSNQLPPTAQMFNKSTGQTVEPTHSSWKPEHELPIAGHHHKNGFKKTPLIIVAAVLGFLGLYTLLDSGLIVDVDLPVHFFSQDEETSQSQQPVAQTPAPTQTNQLVIEDSSTELPDGKIQYTNETLGFKFVYPAEWGETETISGTDLEKLFLLNFNPEKNPNTDSLSIELRAQSSDTEINDSDSRYAKGYVEKDGKFYRRSGSDGNPQIDKQIILGQIDTALGKALLIEAISDGPGNVLEVLINLNNRTFPGMNLTFAHFDESGNPIIDGKSYTSEDINTLEEVLASFDTV